MPSVNKRVNLTLTDEVYDRLQEFKKKNGIISDATACLQLLVQQLKEQEQTAEMMRIMKEMTVEQLMEYSNKGLQEMKERMDKE